jgi:glycerophosphoryl diester phosphodiesterase
VAHQLGVRVDVWTINTEPDMRRVLGYGVDGIMTDRPDVLSRVLGRDGQRQENQLAPQQ